MLLDAEICSHGKPRRSTDIQLWEKTADVTNGETFVWRAVNATVGVETKMNNVRSAENRDSKLSVSEKRAIRLCEN